MFPSDDCTDDDGDDDNDGNDNDDGYDDNDDDDDWLDGLLAKTILDVIVSVAYAVSFFQVPDRTIK